MAKKKQSKSALEKAFLRDLEKVSRQKLSGPVKKTKVKASIPVAKKNSGYQKIYRIQNKLDKKGLSVKEKRELEKVLSKEKKAIGYTGLTKRESERVTKEKRSLTTKQSALLKKFKDKRTSKKTKNKIAKELMETSSRLRDLNKKLDKKQDKLPKKKEKTKVVDGDIRSEEPGWVVQANYIDPALKAKVIKKFIIDGVSIKRSAPDKVYEVWQDLYERLLLKGSEGIAVIIESAKRKTMEIFEKL